MEQQNMKWKVWVVLEIWKAGGTIPIVLGIYPNPNDAYFKVVDATEAVGIDIENSKESVKIASGMFDDDDEEERPASYLELTNGFSYVVQGITINVGDLLWDMIYTDEEAA